MGDPVWWKTMCITCYLKKRRLFSILHIIDSINLLSNHVYRSVYISKLDASLPPMTILDKKEIIQVQC